MWSDTKAAAHLQHPTPGSTPMHFPSPPCPSSPAPLPPPPFPQGGGALYTLQGWRHDRGHATTSLTDTQPLPHTPGLARPPYISPFSRVEVPYTLHKHVIMMLFYNTAHPSLALPPPHPHPPTDVPVNPPIYPTPHPPPCPAPPPQPQSHPTHTLPKTLLRVPSPPPFPQGGGAVHPSQARCHDGVTQYGAQHGATGLPPGARAPGGGGEGGGR